MYNYSGGAILGSFLLFLSACTTTTTTTTTRPLSTPTPTASSSTSQAVLSPGDAITLDKLPGQRLEAGECGLFLFAANPSPRLVFFSESTKSMGKIVLNGQEIALSLQSFDGTIIGQFYTQQSFASSSGHTVDVTLNGPADIRDGTQIDSASLRVKTPDGWSMIVPTRGAMTCQG